MLFALCLSSAVASDLGLRAHYNFESGPNDQVGSFHGSTPGGYNSPSYSDTGICGDTMKLDGNNEYVLLPDALMGGLEDWSVSVWFRPDNNPAQWERVFDFGTSTHSDGGAILAPVHGHVSGAIGVSTSESAPSNGSEALSCNVDHNNGTWYHAVYTFEKDVGVRFFLDGVDCGTTTWAAESLGSVATTDLQLYVGRSNWGNDPLYDGRIDELRFYDRALTAAEASELESNPCGPFDDDGDGVDNNADQCWGDDASGDDDGDDTCNDLDCDDTNAGVFPGATEQCNGVDEDCNGVYDDGHPASLFYLDGDDDGVGVTGSSVSACVAPPGRVALADDCDDTNPDVFPGNPDLVVLDGLDNDCSDGGAGDECFRDNDNDGFGGDQIWQSADKDCTDNLEAPVAGDCHTLQAHSFPGNPVVVVNDGFDNDCSGGVDECFEDGDGDGVGEAIIDSSNASCADSGESAVGDDCDDTDPDRSPAEEEVCDGIDNDCDDEVDPAGVADATWYIDGDGDGYALDNATGVVGCAPPLDGEYVLQRGDCDDVENAVFPLAVEVCDGVDNNCDEVVDDADPSVGTVFYRDTDGDGVGLEPVLLCAPAPGYVLVGEDCDDTDVNVFPDAPEPCDGTAENVDLDCDGTNGGPALFVDGDGDGFAGTVPLTDCDAEGTTLDGDCDDDDPATFPNAPEILNDGVDQNCDGEDEATLPPTPVDPPPPVTEEPPEDTATPTSSDGFGDAPPPPSQGCTCDAVPSAPSWALLAGVLGLTLRRRRVTARSRSSSPAGSVPGLG